MREGTLPSLEAVGQRDPRGSIHFHDVRGSTWLLSLFLKMGFMFVLFHTRGTLAWVNDLLNKPVIGDSICAFSSSRPLTIFDGVRISSLSSSVKTLLNVKLRMEAISFAYLISLVLLSTSGPTLFLMFFFCFVCN